MHINRDGGQKHIFSASWLMGGLFCRFGQLLLTAVSGLHGSMMKLFSEWFLQRWVWLVVQLEPAFVTTWHASSSVPGWSCFMSARAQGLWAALWTLAMFRYRILCPAQLNIYTTLTAEGISWELQRAACILFAFEVPRYTMWYIMGTKYAQMESDDHRHAQM